DEGKITLVNAVEKDGELVETEEETGIWAWKHPHADGSERLVRLTGDVRFYDVDFSYVPEKQVLYDIDLYAEPGQKLAFVGATGAGKTTLITQMTRVDDVQHGQITYDGIDVQLIKKDDLRRSLGLVLQDTHLFTGTIEENIKYGKPDATHEEVVRAARLANAHYFIRHLENGYDTMLTGDGSALSQGQRQLLAIARAALANPPVLILDEATSSIDSRTEKLVQSGMDRLMNGRTTFVIAHRLSTIQNSNAIMVMDHGRIIERGNHASLLEKKGTYYRLYTGDLEID
ncbi:MAG: ATP-binding cassette domain-containing protein, partial [Solobacterium sp.]|nr:ATP-binding cassette domain-containing protein [Solobacterium sp.]